MLGFHLAQKLNELRRLTDADRVSSTRSTGDPSRVCAKSRAREVVVDFLAGSNEYGATGPSLQKYFDQFAVAARRAMRRSPPSDNACL